MWWVVLWWVGLTFWQARKPRLEPEVKLAITLTAVP